MTERWTDEKLDGLKQEMDLRFDYVDRQFEQVDKRFDKIEARLDTIDARFVRLDERLDAMYRLMILFGGSMFAAMASIVAAVIVTQL